MKNELKLTPNRLAILNYLDQCSEPISPTQIGKEVGFRTYNSASAWTCNNIMPLVSAGYVDSNKGRYSITQLGRDAIKKGNY